MTRCDYDGVFYRVFCVTLLAIAFTFTVILTNVFIDIDGLLSFKGRAKSHSSPVIQNNPNDLTINAATKLDTFDDDAKDYEELDDNYRTKRSLETQNVLFHITNPKMKSILTNRLANLLEKLDEEEAIPHIKNDKDTADRSKEPIMKMGDVEILDDRNVKKLEQNADVIEGDKFLHLVMHNILLQGIIDHMDINEIYKRINSFMKNYKSSHNLKVEKSEIMKHPLKLTSKIHPANEVSFFNELLNCKGLHDQIMELSVRNENMESGRIAKAHKGPKKVLIKTVIDINSMTDDKINKKNDTNSIENIKGIIKLFYNGKSVKVNNMDDVTTATTSKSVETTSATQIKSNTKISTEDVSDSSEQNQAHFSKSYLSKIFNNYFKKLYKLDTSDSPDIRQIETKRLKRHVRIRYKNNETTTEQSKIMKNKKDDDELYVEIETHFDSKGLKGEKKKKLISSLIQKIKTALRDSGDVNKSLVDKKKKHKHEIVKKRTQNPLDYNKRLSSKIIPEQVDLVIHRQLNPISKTVASHETVPNIYDNTGESWKKTYTGPGFLTPSKSINSAEMNEVNTQFSNIISTNGISQRMQKPLNTEGSEEDVGGNSYFDLGNLKFFIKEIDGSGFSVGFNQYVDEPPDAETMKLFTGLENIIQTYHQKYDPVLKAGPEDSLTEKTDNTNNDFESVENEHLMVRRSINGHDYHSNDYKVIYDSNYLPYENYQEIYNDSKRKLYSFKDYKHKNIKLASKDLNAPFIVNEDIFTKDLKPAEIFGLANLLDRKKRDTKSKQILNLKSKIKINKYLNTKAMATKKIFLNKKRGKRQIGKIRIIASEIPNQHRSSDENVFVVSDENIFADRAIVREFKPPLVEESADKVEEQHYDIISPYVYEEPKEPTYITNIFDDKSRHNSLMSRYPHIFLDEKSRSKEEYLLDNTNYSKTITEPPPDIINIEQTTTTQSTEAVNEHLQPMVYDEVSDLVRPKTDYKLTVKIMPRNLTDANTGFKEVHTSINKSYNKNGLMYSSLVNVSEISKIIKLNRTKTGIEISPMTTMSPKVKAVNDQKAKMSILLKQHKYRIDEQLAHLNKEKQRLDAMLESTKETEIKGSKSNELVDLVLSTDPLKVVKLTQKEVTHLAAVAFSKKEVLFEEIKQVTTVTPPLISTMNHTTTPNTTTTSTPTITTTTVPPTTIDQSRDLNKMNILNTIEKNDKLTNDILKKIDKNTDILRTFLTKLLDVIPPQTTRKSIPNDINVLSKIDLNEPMSNWKEYQTTPNSEVKNTHVSIPFVYAYQQPYQIPNSKSTNPVQSIVYQGHIHTNTINNSKLKNMKPKQSINVNSNTKRELNRSRFFVDNLVNDFKMIPQTQKTENIHVPNVFAATNVTKH